MTNKKIYGRRWKVGDKVKWIENKGWLNEKTKHGIIRKERITGRFGKGDEWYYKIDVPDDALGYTLMRGSNLKKDNAKNKDQKKKMKQKKMKWKCHGCGREFATKKDCETHIKKTHWDYISRTAGLASFTYYCEKIEQPPEESHWDRIGREQDEQLRIQERMTGSPDPILAPFKSFKMPTNMALQKPKTKTKKRKRIKQKTLFGEL